MPNEPKLGLDKPEIIWHKCVYACVCLYVLVYMYVIIVYVCVCMHMHECLCTCLFMYVSVWVCLCAYLACQMRQKLGIPKHIVHMNKINKNVKIYKFVILKIVSTVI